MGAKRVSIFIEIMRVLCMVSCEEKDEAWWLKLAAARWLVGSNAVGSGQESCNDELLSDVKMAAVCFFFFVDISRLGGVEVHVTAIKGTGDLEYPDLKPEIRELGIFRVELSSDLNLKKSGLFLDPI